MWNLESSQRYARLWRAIQGAISLTASTPEACVPSTEKVFADRREDVDEYDFFVHHGGAMKTVRGKVQDVSRRSNPFFAFNEEPHAAADDERHLLVHVGVFRRDQERHESEANDHNSFADDHLPFDAFGRMFDGNVRPVQMLSYAGNGSRGLARFRWDQRHG